MSLRREKLLLAGSTVLGALAALVSISVLARLFTPTQFSIAMTLVLINGLVGALDWSRPIIVRRSQLDDSYLSARALLTLAAPSIIIGSLLVFALLSLFVPKEYFSGFGISVVALGCAIFLFSFAFWGVLDARLRVGTAQTARIFSTVFLYLFFMLEAIAKLGLPLEAYFFATSSVSAAIFFGLARSHMSIGYVKIEWAVYRELIFVLVQNAAKILNDFLDRILAAAVLPIAVIGVYNSIYELTAKSSIPSQLLANYKYPIICRDGGQRENFLIASALLSLVTAAFGSSLLIAGEALLGLVLGDLGVGYGKILAAMTGIFGVYSLNFAGQALLRSTGQLISLATVFWVGAIAGILWIGYVSITSTFGLGEVLVTCLLLKGFFPFLLVPMARYLSYRAILCSVLAYLSNLAIFVAAYLGL